MNPVITILIALTSIMVVLGILIKNRIKNKKKKQELDNYNDFHLGEITIHDTNPKFTQREKEYARWSSRQLKTKEAENLKELRRKGEA